MNKREKGKRRLLIQETVPYSEWKQITEEENL